MTTISSFFHQALKGRFNLSRAFSAQDGFRLGLPWAMPTAFMNHAVGVKEGNAQPLAGALRHRKDETQQ